MKVKILSKFKASLQEATVWLRGLLKSNEFKEQAKNSPECFTRKRVLDLSTLTAFIINMVKSSTKVAITNFIENITGKLPEISQQAVSKARQKLNWRACRLLHVSLVNFIYSFRYETWHNYRILAIDGSKTQLPSDPKLKKFFGTYGSKTSPTAQVSILYDVLNKIVVHGLMKPISISERVLAKVHMIFLSSMKSFAKELIIFDRGYASLEMFKFCEDLGIKFVMRLKTKFNKEIDKLPIGCHKFVFNRKEITILVRVIKFKLSTGEVETLVTNIFDYNFGMPAFQKLYNLRWTIETEYSFIKHNLDLENFSCRSKNGIYQDFYISLLVANIIKLAANDAQKLREANKNDKKNKYEYNINYNLAVGFYKNRFILALLEENDEIRAEKLNQLISLISDNIKPIRPKRSVERNKTPRCANFYFNQKSNC
jgi:hypothetical protein